MKLKKLTPTQIFSLGILSILFILTVTFLFIFLLTYKPSIGFYNVSPTTQNAIIKTLSTSSKNSKKEKKFNSIILDSTIPLSMQQKEIKKCKLLFVTKDLDTLEFTQNKSIQNKILKPLPQNLLQEMPNTIATSVPAENQKIFYVPILYDFYQIDVNYNFFKQIDTSYIDYFADLETCLQKEKKFVSQPLIFDGKDTATLLNILGMFIEAFSTPDEYINIQNRLYQAYKTDTISYSAIITEINSLYQTSPAFSQAVNTIKKLSDNKFISKEVFNYNKEDSVFYANKNLCGFFFTTLSQHRSISPESIGNYTSIYMPSYENNFKRMFSAPEIDVLCLSNSKVFLELIKYLSIYDQTGLSTFAGLSPVNRECTPADLQASDVRYWLAASSGPLIPLSGALPSAQAQYLAYSAVLNLLQ